MRKYILLNDTVSLCNLTSVQTSPTALTEVGMKLLQKVRKSKSNVINIKAVVNSDSKKNKAEISIKEKLNK